MMKINSNSPLKNYYSMSSIENPNIRVHQISNFSINTKPVQPPTKLNLFKFNETKRNYVFLSKKEDLCIEKLKQQLTNMKKKNNPHKRPMSQTTFITETNKTLSKNQKKNIRSLRPVSASDASNIPPIRFSLSPVPSYSHRKKRTITNREGRIKNLNSDIEIPKSIVVPKRLMPHILPSADLLKDRDIY
eukprot:TRINITY_DN11595_c0_g1_i1.p1 TRINITY_DN11595_c0_g1~~TRINITY_DN11595_c0_g1_i1.p1  ORF type:complete len:189 (-),score=39.03 TRINITY_DN11595_c0_g1_i1:28-594(-)